VINLSLKKFKCLLPVVWVLLSPLALAQNDVEKIRDNENGITAELKTLTSLGIIPIDLYPERQSGLVNGGNEILAEGSANDQEWRIAA